MSVRRCCIVLALTLLATRPALAGYCSQLQDYAPGAVVNCDFNSKAGDVLTSLAGSPAIQVFCGNSTSGSSVGVTLSPDFGGVTGVNHVSIDTTSYASGQECTLRVTSGTLSGQSVVGSVVGGFSLNATAALRPTVAGRTVAVSSVGETDANLVKWIGTAPNGLQSGRVDTYVGVNGDKSGYLLTVTPPTAAQVAAAIFDEPRAGHVGAGTFGRLLNAIGAGQ